MARLTTMCNKQMTISAQSVADTYKYPLGIIDTNAHLLWQEGYLGRNVKIAVIDSGIDSHADLEGRIIDRKSYVGSITEAHGTHVAGIIGGKGKSPNGVFGMAPECLFYDIQILKNNDAAESDFVSAVDDAIKYDVDIINISLGTPEKSKKIEAAIKKAYNSGIVLVAAAGNYGKNTVIYPGSMPECISVGNYDVNQKRYNPSMSSNRYLDVCAPGTGIFSCDLNNNYGVYSGTSMAAPHVTGLCALYIEKITVEDMRVGTIRTKIERQQYLYSLLKTNVVDPSGNDSLIIGGKRVRYRTDLKPFVSSYAQNKYYYLAPRLI